MDAKKLDLSRIAEDQSQTARIVARLEGEADDQRVELWGEEYSASGGKSPPPPPGTSYS